MSRARIAFVILVVALATSLPIATAAAAPPAPRLGVAASSGCYAQWPVNVVAVVTPTWPSSRITSATATVHWSVGDQVYAMTRAPFSFGNAVHARAAVPLGQPVGVVSIDVQVFVGAVEFDRSVSVRVVCGSSGGVG